MSSGSSKGKRWNFKKLLTRSPVRRKSAAATAVKVVPTVSSEEGSKAESAKWSTFESILNSRMSRSDLLQQKLRDEIARSKSTDADSSHSSADTDGGYWSEPIHPKHRRAGSDGLFGPSDEEQTLESPENEDLLSQQVSSSSTLEDEETDQGDDDDDSSVGSFGQLVQHLTCGAVIQDFASDCCGANEGGRTSIIARDIHRL